MLRNIVKNKIKTYKWRKNNSHNYTTLKTFWNEQCISVGNFTYGSIDAVITRNDVVLKIGAFCSIADEVKFIVSSDHRIDILSSYPIKAKITKEVEFEAISKGDIVIADDVWIGYRATIMSGVHIGQGAVVAAGSVVTKDVPPYAIVGGVPAKVIKYRFSQDIIDELLKIDFSSMDEKFIRENIDDFYKRISDICDTNFFKCSKEVNK